MTLLEYVQSLQDQGATDIPDKVQEWKKKNQPKVEKEVIKTPVKQAKTEVVVEKDATAATTPGASESLSSGNGKPTFTSMYDEDATAKLKLEDINRQIERSIATDAQRALKTSKIVFQDEYEPFDPYGAGEAGEVGLESRKSTLGLVESKPVSEENKLIRSFKESTDLSKDQFDSLYSDIYDNENLFTPVETQKLIEGSTGSGMDIKMGLMTPSLQETITIIPNEEELKTALKQLESKPRKIGAPKISKQEIEDRARRNMFNSKARDIKMQNATDFIFNIPEYQKDEDGNFLRDEEGNKIPNRKAAQDLIAENIITNRNKATWNVKDFGKDLEFSLSGFQESSLVKNFQSYSKALKGKQEKIKKLADAIVKKQKNGKPVIEDLIEYKNEANNYKSFIDQYNKLGINLKNESIDLENRVVEYNDMISSIEDSDVQLDALGRVYKPFEKAYTDLVLGAAGVAINSAAFLETALNQMSVRTMELDEEGKPTGELAPGSTFFQDEAKKLAEVKEFVSNKYYKPVSFKNAFNSLENFTEYAAGQAIAQAPIFGAIASGGFGMLAVSAASGGEYQAGRQLEAEQLFGREADEATVFLQALGFGASEYVFGVGPTALILKGTYRGATASGKRKILDGWKNYYRTLKKDGPLDLGLAIVDAAGEGLTTISQNGIDGKPLFENVSESVFTGGLFGSLTASAPYFKGAFSAALSDYKTNADYRENLKMINTLDRSMNNPWITEADKAGIEKSKQDLIDQNNEIVEQRVNLATNNLNKQGGELLQQSMKRQEELRNQAEALDNNNSIPDDQKAAILNALEAEFNQIEAGADKFKQAFTNTFGLLSNKEQSRLKTEAERLLKVDGNQNISGDKITRKAEQLHTKEKLEQTLQSDQSTLKALAGAGIEVGYSVEDTNAGAIKSFTAMMNFRAADENNSITQEQADSLIEEFTEGINDGTLNGFNVPSTNTKTGKKVYDSITSVQNSIANERSQTSLHELGHVITTEALGSDPAAFEETKNLILSYLEKANPEAYTRITTRTRGQSADEVLMVFFEEVADNKIKLDEAKGTGFLGYLGSMLGTAASKASNTDYNYNFKGEIDIVNFAKELGRKLKDGTLTVEDVKTIQQEGLGGKKEVPVIPLDEVVVTGVAASKSSKETTFTPEQDKAIGETINEIKALEKEGKAIAKKFGKPFQKGAKQIRLENELTASIKPLVEKIVTNRTKALYDPIADDARRNVTRQEFQDSMRSDLQTMAINEYNGTQKLEKFIINRGFLRANSLAQRLGIKSVEEGITQGIEAAEDVAAEDTTVAKETKDTSSKIKPSSFISNEAVAKIKEQVQSKIKGIDPKNLTFKKLGDLAPEIIAQELGIPVKKLTSPTANLSKGDATAIQQFVNKNADKLLKILPEGAVVEAATDKLLGTSTGVPKGLLNAFYTKQARLGKGAGLAPFKLNKGISKADFLETFGIVEGKKAEGFDARSPQAQALKGIAGLYGKLVTNEIVRSDTDLSLEDKQDVAAGKNKAMASKRTQKLNWKETDEAIVASFKIGDRTYKTTLEETAFMEFDEGQTYQDIEDIAKDLDILEDAEGNPIESSENFYHLEFGDTELGKGITGKGNAFEVFTTTMNGVVDYLKANPSIEGVVFTAKEPSRIRLYKTLSQVLAGKLNGSSGFKNDTFIVSTKPATVSKPKSMASKRPDIKSRFNTASTTKTGGVSKANNVQPISRGSVEYMGGKGGLKTETRWTPSKKDIEYIPTFMNKAASLFDKDFFTTGNFAFGGRSLIGTKSDLTKALEGAVYNKDAPKMPKRKPYKKTKKYDKNFHEKLNTKEFLDNEKAKMPYLKFIFEQIQADLKSNPNHLKYWEAVLNDAQNSQGHFMRFLAPIAFYPVDKNGNPVFDQDIVEEHTMPQSNVAAFLLQSALDGNIEQDFGFIEDNYFQGALLLADDKKTRGKDYNYVSNMGETFLESDNPSSWMRYNNENVNANQGGIDFNAYKLLNGQTIAESLDAGLPLKDRTLDALENQRNEILKQLKDPSYKAKEAIKVFKELAPGKAMASKRDSDLIPDAIKYDRPITVQTAINALAKTDKALELARKLDQPVKKIRVFDFDDTLARTKSNVLYTMPDGTTGAIDAATFAKEAGNMEACLLYTSPSPRDS